MHGAAPGRLCKTSRVDHAYSSKKGICLGVKFFKTWRLCSHFLKGDDFVLSNPVKSFRTEPRYIIVILIAICPHPYLRTSKILTATLPRLTLKSWPESRGSARFGAVVGRGGLKRLDILTHHNQSLGFSLRFIVSGGLWWVVVGWENIKIEKLRIESLLPQSFFSTHHNSPQLTTLSLFSNKRKK